MKAKPIIARTYAWGSFGIRPPHKTAADVITVWFCGGRTDDLAFRVGNVCAHPTRESARNCPNRRRPR